MNIDINFLGILIGAIMASSVSLILAASGELITERSGVLNLGVEGMMIIGAISGFALMIITDNLFLAIIVAVLGRLNPIGIVFASLIVALTYLGAETAQIFLQVPKYTGQVFQGMILFFLLAADFLLFFRIKFLGLKKYEY